MSLAVAPVAADEPRRLAALAQACILDTPPEPAFDDLVVLAASVCQAPVALISLVDERRQWFKAKIGLTVTETARDLAFCAYTILGDELLEVRDARADARFADNPLVTSPPWIRFYAGLPILGVGGYRLGSLCVIDHVPRALTDTQVTLLRALARQVSAQMELRRTAVTLAVSERVAVDAGARLETERAWLRGLLRAATSHAIIGCARDGTIRLFSEGAQRLLGYREGELVGRATPLLFHDPAELAARAAELGIAPGIEVLTAVARGGEAETRDWTYLARSGRRIPVSVTVTAVRDERGALDGFLGIARDVTEERQAEEARAHLTREQAARAAAEGANRAKDDFLSVLSHELRTPLTSVLGWLSILEHKERDPAVVSHGLAIIARNAGAQLRIVEDILDLSRIVTGKLELHLAPVDLVALTRDAADRARPGAEAAGISLSVAADPEQVSVTADEGRLVQVIGNLLSNAIKFTDRGGRIDVRVDGAHGRPQIRVSDTGVGITPEFLPHVFERFRQGDTGWARKHGGLGLGLALCQHLVEQHGGTITAESAGLGCGASFTVELPEG